MDINKTSASLGATTNSSGKKTDNSNTLTSAEQHNASPAGESSRVTVTDSALKLLELEKALGEMPSFDPEKVASIKQALSDGSYTINASRIAEKLIKFERDLA